MPSEGRASAQLQQVWPDGQAVALAFLLTQPGLRAQLVPFCCEKWFASPSSVHQFVCKLRVSFKKTANVASILHEK